MARQAIRQNEIIPFTGEMFNGFYEQVLKTWQEKQEINLSRAFSRN